MTQENDSQTSEIPPRKKRIGKPRVQRKAWDDAETATDSPATHQNSTAAATSEPAVHSASNLSSPKTTVTATTQTHKTPQTQNARLTVQDETELPDPEFFYELCYQQLKSIFMTLDKSVNKLHQSGNRQAFEAEWNYCAKAINRLGDDVDAFEEKRKPT